jgi:hypothetical protein
MSTVRFQPGVTWAKLGFGVYSDSLSYKAILDENPQWNVLEYPPAGTPISVDSVDFNSGSGGQGISILSALSTSEEDYSPYDTKLEYMRALFRYSSTALANASDINGYTIDSKSALTGKK